MKKDKLNSQSGQSLIEMLVVLAIVGIVTVIAVFSLGNARNNLQRKNIAREFKVSLERARFDSVKRRVADDNAMARVTINNATSFSLATDLNRNGTIENSDVHQVNFTNSNVRIVGNNLTFPVTIRFDRRGFATATNSLGAEISLNLEICENCTVATANSSNADTISVSPTGTVLMMEGNETLPTFQNPNTSVVSGGSQINPLVTVTQTPQATPTPAQCTVILTLCL